MKYSRAIFDPPCIAGGTTCVGVDPIVYRVLSVHKSHKLRKSKYSFFSSTSPLDPIIQP